MTYTQIQEHLRQAGKPVTNVTLHRYLRACQITALKPLTRPRRYTDDAAKIITKWLGLDNASTRASGPAPVGRMTIAPLAQLKTTAKAARRAKR